MKRLGTGAGVGRRASGVVLKLDTRCGISFIIIRAPDDR